MNENVVMSPVDSPKKNWTLTAILLVSALPIIAAYTMYFTGIGVPDNTVNAGVLLPKAISVHSLIPDDVLPQVIDKKKWRLLIPVGEICSKQCESNFYVTRQVHTRLGEKSLRIERVIVNIGGEMGYREVERLRANHPNIKHFTVSRDRWHQWLAVSKAVLSIDTDPYYLLVDQEGNAMMSYTNIQTGNQLLKDIKRALKYSIDYQ